MIKERHKTHIFCIIILLIFPKSAFSQIQSFLGEVDKIWIDGSIENRAKVNWEAKWIWLSDSVKSDMMLARRSFVINKMPKKANLKVTASSQYQLFINGIYVGRGPARSAPHHQSFDILNINNLLRVGENVLAIKVHRQANMKSYHHHIRGGLLAQLDCVGDEKVSIWTDYKWKVSPDLSWSNNAPLVNRFQPAVNDHVDFRKSQRNWISLDFDDREWSDAEELMRNVGWPLPQKNDLKYALTPPWTSLITRDLPYLNENEKSASNLIMADFLSEGNLSKSIKITKDISKNISKTISDYRSEKGPLIISPTERLGKRILLFDYCEVLNGSAQLDIIGPIGLKVEIWSAPYILNNEFKYHIVDSDFKDEIILSGERDFWEATYWKPTRYLGIVLENISEPIKIFGVGIRQISYPFKTKGYIKSIDNPWIEKYMKASAKTIDVCTTDGYTDNYRERRQYSQTGFYAALGNYWIFGDYFLQRRYLVQVAEEQQANGIMPAYAPLNFDDYMIILDSNCLWIRSLKNYFLYSGDSSTVRALIPNAYRLMNLLDNYTNEIGLIDNPPYPYWLDHAVNDRRGSNFTLNAHYLGALEDFSQILIWLNDPLNKIYKKKAKQIRKSLQTYFWDDDNSLFADAYVNGELSDKFSEHSNGMALAMKIASKNQASLIASKILAKDKHNYIKRESGITMVTPALSYFLHKGLCDFGYVNESFDLFRLRFDKMLDSNYNGTLWEEWWLDATGRSGQLSKIKTRSDAQTESAFVPALFAEFLLGLKVIKPGMSLVEISKPETTIKHIHASVPTPQGNLIIEWNLSKKNLLSLSIPKEIDIVIDLEKLIPTLNQPILLNGNIFNVGLEGSLTLSDGDYVLSF